MLNKILGRFSHDIGIDLGTANTLVYVRGKGIVIKESSVVAINKKTKEILAIGDEAKKMVGRTPAHIVAIRPLVDGVVSDYETTEQMLRYFIDKVHASTFSLFPRPRVVIGIPYGVTEVERRAVEEATTNAGAREVFLIEEPMAAAIGARLSIQDPTGSMIVDIGGGTTEVAVISMGGIVASRSLRIAGDELNESIIEYARENFNLLLGERTAEDIKMAIGSAMPMQEPMEMAMKGRDLITGLPREVTISDEKIREALSKPIYLIGGGALLKELDALITAATETRVYVADDPISCVVRGTGIVLEDLKSLEEVLLPTEYKRQ
ncbi:MAG: rod shape-determining protein [Candidatus Berkelbacteria bacterium]|nr:rod shape-determining protein [Candidatus Berkelbacteria bacterium]